MLYNMVYTEIKEINMLWFTKKNLYASRIIEKINTFNLLIDMKSQKVRGD